MIIVSRSGSTARLRAVDPVNSHSNRYGTAIHCPSARGHIRPTMRLSIHVFVTDSPTGQRSWVRRPHRPVWHARCDTRRPNRPSLTPTTSGTTESCSSVGVGSPNGARSVTGPTGGHATRTTRSTGTTPTGRPTNDAGWRRSNWPTSSEAYR